MGNFGRAPSHPDKEPQRLGISLVSPLPQAVTITPRGSVAISSPTVATLTPTSTPTVTVT